MAERAVHVAYYSHAFDDGATAGAVGEHTIAID